MKKLLIVIMMIYLLPAKADILLDIMNGTYPEVSNTSNNCEESYNEEQYGNSGGDAEHYSWDNLYLCNYCDIEIIIDPYATIEESDY